MYINDQYDNNLTRAIMFSVVITLNYDELTDSERRQPLEAMNK